MASIFLSYDRRDLDTAQVVAKALEKAGHHVWWDQHVRGGAEFSEEIEQALDDADKVVVLWSRHSVKSAWVRDEAAAGRDKGRLVPALIEPVQPPIGFRQYQCIDLSGPASRRRHQRLAELARAVDASAGEASRTTPPSPPEASLARNIPVRSLAIAIASVLLLVAAAALWRNLETGRTEVVSIVPADGQSRELAQSILLQLASLPSSRSGSVRLIGDSSASGDANLVFQAAAKGRGSGSLALISRKDGSLLWSRQFPPSDADLGERLSVTAGKVLGCAIEGLTDSGGALKREELKIYLGACSAMGDAGWDTGPILQALREVTAKAPRFGAAWGKLLLAETSALDFVAAEDREAALAQIRKDILAARKANPGLAEASLAEASIRPLPPIAPVIELIEQAKSQNPSSEPVLSAHSDFMQMVGRSREAVDDAKMVTDLDPLSSEAQSNYILALAYSDHLDQARQQLAKAKMTWPDSTTLAEAEVSIEMRYGDVRKAMSSGLFAAAAGSADYLTMRIDPSATNVEHFFSRAMRLDLTGDQLGFALQAFSEIGRPDKAYALLEKPGLVTLPTRAAYILFRPHMKSFRADPRFMAFAKKLGLVDYWQSSGKWPVFCADPRLPYDCKEEAAKLDKSPKS